MSAPGMIGQSGSGDFSPAGELCFLSVTTVGGNGLFTAPKPRGRALTRAQTQAYTYKSAREISLCQPNKTLCSVGESLLLCCDI